MYLSISVPIPHPINYYRFDTLNNPSLPFIKIALALLVYILFHMNVQISLSGSKNSYRDLIRMAISLYINLERIYTFSSFLHTIIPPSQRTL